MENQIITNQKNDQEVKILPLNEVMERVEKLPDKIQKILLSDELADYFLELERQNNLNYSQSDIMIGITHNVFLGLLDSHVFIPVLSGELTDNGVNPIIAKEIAQKIESKFVAPIRDDLDKIYHRFKAMESLEKEVGSITEKTELSQSKIQKSSLTESATKEALSKEEFQPLVIKPEESQNEIIKTEEFKPEEKTKSIAEIKIEKPLEEIKNQPIIQEATPSPKRTFLSFLKFKRPEEKIGPQPEQPIIIGKETEVKPVLDKESPWVISFEDVKPSKEKVISEVEIKTEPEVKSISVEKPSEPPKPPKTIEPFKKEEVPTKPLEVKEEKPNAPSTAQIGPIKIVNYSSETPKEENSKQAPKFDLSISTPPSTSESVKPISEEVKKKEPEEIEIPTLEKKEEFKKEKPENVFQPQSSIQPEITKKPSLESVIKDELKSATAELQLEKQQKIQQTAPESIQKEVEKSKEEQKEPLPKEETINIPAENVIDLRKLKF